MGSFVKSGTPWSFCRNWKKLGLDFMQLFFHELCCNVGDTIHSDVLRCVKNLDPSAVEYIEGSDGSAVREHLETNEHVAVVHHYKYVGRLAADLMLHEVE